MVRKLYKRIETNKVGLLWISASAVLLLAFLYMFGLNATVFNTAKIIT
ncbi:MAG: hypothetical protein G01um1014107_110, partial [Parcubacteria group bacterium Gr01-1014_107]